MKTWKILGSNDEILTFTEDDLIYTLYKTDDYGEDITILKAVDNLNGFEFIDIDIERNFYGRQINSKLIKTDSDKEAFMIRAPSIVNCGKKVEILDTFNGNPIFIKQQNVYCTTFHPELGKLDNNNPIVKIFA